MTEKKDIVVKTTLTESQYKAMTEVREAEGMTEAGYLRHLVLHHVVESQDKVSRMREILDR